MNFDADYTLTIDGAADPGRATLEVVNPATGEAFAQAPDAGAAELDRAVASARASS